MCGGLARGSRGLNLQMEWFIVCKIVCDCGRCFTNLYPPRLELLYCALLLLTTQFPFWSSPRSSFLLPPSPSLPFSLLLSLTPDSLSVLGGLHLFGSLGVAWTGTGAPCFERQQGKEAATTTATQRSTALQQGMLSEGIYA